MQLYSFFNSSTSYRARIALALKGLDFDVIRRLLRATIDIVVHLRARGGRRCITGIDFAADRAPAGLAHAPAAAPPSGGT